MLRTLYGDDERYVETYWSRFGPETYLVGDAAIRDKDGYLWIVGRIDDVINVSGHRLSTAEVESAIVAHEKVAEAAVVAQSDELTGQAIVAFVTLQGDLEGTPGDRGPDPRARRRAHRQARAAQAHPVDRRPAQDALGEDHAAAPQRHRRGPSDRRRDDAARPDRDGRARRRRSRPRRRGRTRLICSQRLTGAAITARLRPCPRRRRCPPACRPRHTPGSVLARRRRLDPDVVRRRPVVAMAMLTQRRARGAGAGRARDRPTALRSSPGRQ